MRRPSPRVPPIAAAVTTAGQEPVSTSGNRQFVKGKQRIADADTIEEIGGGTMITRGDLALAMKIKKMRPEPSRSVLLWKYAQMRFRACNFRYSDLAATALNPRLESLMARAAMCTKLAVMPPMLPGLRSRVGRQGRRYGGHYELDQCAFGQSTPLRQHPSK